MPPDYHDELEKWRHQGFLPANRYERKRNPGRPARPERVEQLKAAAAEYAAIKASGAGKAEVDAARLKRDEVVRDAKAAGVTLREIAMHVGLTHAGIGKIVKRGR